MKIFYGVQGTGNGHITRARVMKKELSAAGLEVTFQFTGRPEEEYFDIEEFKTRQFREGLTFCTEKGDVKYIKTALQSSPVRFIKDIKSLDFSDFDLIITDFEPVTAWAAKIQKKNILGIGHQYAFNHAIPRAKSDPIANLVMKYFAPTNTGLGLHWHHFNQNILPPIIETPKLPKNSQKNKVVVYLPFEDQSEVINALSSFKNFQFHLYSPKPVVSKYDHIICNPLSRKGFLNDLHSCVGIISNAGFELASESLQLGKKILAKPLHSQMEQVANAVALKQLDYGHTTQEITPAVIEKWLDDKRALRITYPNVAKIIVDWISNGMEAMDPHFIRQVWDSVEVLRLDIE